jgi:tetratricopeptide (TPR) repeat protein
MPGAVFLSYASQDADGVRRLCETLRAAGVEVWFDQEGGLEHGDEWDAKIRRQIKECVLFVPVISATTQGRPEGYFRLEWELAAERAMSIASGVPFILPVVIDATREPDALVPDRFRKVQWMRLPGGVVSPEAQARFLKLWSQRSGALQPPSTREGEAGRTPLARAASKRRGIVSALAVAAIALAAWGVGRWREHPALPPSASPAPGAPAPASATGPSAPARELADKARAIYDAIGFTRADLAVAEQLASQATVVDPDSAYAWAVRARTKAAYIQRYWAYNETIRGDTETFAKRALAIDANQPEALTALAYVLDYAGAEGQAEAYLRRALALSPGDSRIIRFLGPVVSRTGRPQEGVALIQDLVKREPGDALARYDLALMYVNDVRVARAGAANLPEALAQVDAALAIAPTDGILLLKARLVLATHGDVGTAQALIDRLSVAGRTEDRAVFVAMYCGLLERDPDRVRAASALTVQDYFEDRSVDRPKAWGDALAERIAGRQGLARIRWQTAEAVVRKRLQDDPTNQYYRSELAITLAWQDRAAEAAQEIAPVEAAWREEMSERDNRAPLVRLGEFYAAAGDAPRAVPYLRRALPIGSYFISKSILTLDPWYDKLRGQPEFEALLKEGDGRAAK